MTKSKYSQIIHEESKKAIVSYDPEDWLEAKERIYNFIKEIDKAHEVYQMENTIKS